MVDGLRKDGLRKALAGFLFADVSAASSFSDVSPVSAASSCSDFSSLSGCLSLSSFGARSWGSAAAGRHLGGFTGSADAAAGRFLGTKSFTSWASTAFLLSLIASIVVFQLRISLLAPGSILPLSLHFFM